jgi:hypothetical protein
MTIARIRAAVALAREAVTAIDLPAEPQSADPAAYRAWEGLMLQAASRIAASVAHDPRILDAAVGPPIEVGVNPPWRVLLMVAQLQAREHHSAAVRNGAVVKTIDEPRLVSAIGLGPATPGSARLPGSFRWSEHHCTRATQMVL